MAASRWRRATTAGVALETAAHLHQVIEGMRLGQPDAAAFDTLIAELDALPPQLAQQVTRLSFYAYRYPLPKVQKPGLVERLLSFGKATPEMPSPAIPAGRLAWIRLGHPDGFEREKGLRALDDAPSSALRLALLLQRADDWVPQVAAAAHAALERLADRVPPAAVRAIAPFVTAHYLKRLGKTQIAAPVAALLVREESWPETLDWLKSGADPAVVPALRLALLSDAVDRHLPELLAARHYLVRALAARTLLAGHAEIFAGWISATEVSYAGRRTRQVRNTVRRPLGIIPDVEETLRLAARDRTTTVRKLAADTLIAFRDRLADLDGLLALYDGETSPAIRERIDFIRRRRADP